MCFYGFLEQITKAWDIHRTLDAACLHQPLHLVISCLITARGKYKDQLRVIWITFEFDIDEEPQTQDLFD